MKELALIWFMIVLILLLVIPFVALKGVFFFGEERGPEIVVYDHRQERVYQLEVEDYLLGVLGAEMPASFHIEALKAQAVVARTYVLRRLSEYGGQGPDPVTGAHITSNPLYDQEWMSGVALLARWGPGYLDYYHHLSQALEETRGQVLTHQGELIEALYHASAGGRTEDAYYLWENYYPYLQGVESPWDEGLPANMNNYSFCWEELASGFDLADPHHLEVLSRSPSGRVLVMELGERVISGQEFRSGLQLPSTLLNFDTVGNGVVVEARGHGHGVGMSQYGAEGMAREGYSYRAILDYYYQDVKLGWIDY